MVNDAGGGIEKWTRERQKLEVSRSEHVHSQCLIQQMIFSHHCHHRHLNLCSLTEQALEAVEGEKWTLEGQKTEMLRQQQRQLAWTGQALIANSVGVMEEAVDQIRATFLFTSKELKCAPPSRSNLSS